MLGLATGSAPASAQPPGQVSPPFGDPTCDGVIEAADVHAVLAYLVGAEPAGSCSAGAPDLLGALQIAQRTVGEGPLRPAVVAHYPHDSTAFTQGLEFVDGQLIESTGLFGDSDLRLVEPATGEVLTLRAMPDELFAEGLTRVDDRLIQLTWKAERAFIWQANTFEPLGEYAYEGDGWGLCFDGDQLVMSDGSAYLRFRDPGTFLASREVLVTRDGAPVDRLNELECVGGVVWANVWQTDTIVRIDPVSGEVTATVDLSELLQPRPPGANVLNGIAFDGATATFWVTGKYWPTMFQVQFVPGG